MLRDKCKVIVQTEWDGRPADVLIALHARRSAPSVLEFSERSPGRPMVVMLTGTDLYRDLPASSEAARSLDLATRIVTLQEDALTLLAPGWRNKAETIFQSARALAAARKPAGRLACVAAGHLRQEKDPRTLHAAVGLLPRELPIRVRHFGEPLDRQLAREARALERRDERYVYRGARPHGVVRQAIRSAHVLVHPSTMEGGANVIVEAITSGTPVVASRVSGNVGMLGPRYSGYFPVGDARALAKLLQDLLEHPARLRALQRECAARRRLFGVAAEARAVRRLVARLLA
jgi:putative glycosyltransferase (TIGR04348 family)